MTSPISFIRPLTITASMITSSTAVSHSSTEPDWNSTTAYTAGQVRFRPAPVGRRFECLVSHAASSTPPEDDQTRWYDLGATDKTTMFDGEVSTPTIADGTLTQVFQPGAFNAIHLLGLDGTSMTFTVKAAPGGAEVRKDVVALEDSQPPDYYEHFFDPFRPRTDYLVTGLEPYANCEVTITINNPGGIAKCGMGCLGDLVAVGGPALTGSTVEPKSYARVVTDERGRTSIKKGKAAKDLAASAVVNISDADKVVDDLTSILGVPTTHILTDTTTLRSLRGFGLGRGRLTYSQSHAKLDYTVEGMI
jgi:hypothetical protein